MDEKIRKIKFQVFPAVPYLRTMLMGLRYENNQKSKDVLYAEALSALTELAQMENELLNYKLQK